MKMDNGTLSGRIAVITGASSGIGEAAARQLVAAGAKVVVNGRRKQRMDELERSLNKGRKDKAAAGVAGDAAEPGTLDALFAKAREAFGAPADLVVVNAGRGLGGPVTGADAGKFEDILRLNVVGALRLMQKASQEFLKDMAGKDWLKGPHDIVVLGSCVGRNVSPFSAVYGSTKFAVHSLAEGLRRELAPKGIRVTLVEPGIVVSEFQDSAGYSAELVKGFHDRFGPLTMPDDIARGIVFAASQPAHVCVGGIVIRPTRQDYP
jgi:NADP-dependent 3-hydroxy acid dehydrogenase YdfG